MKKIIILLPLIMVFSKPLFSQPQITDEDERRFLSRLKNIIVENDTIRQLNSIKIECEGIILRLSANNLDDKSLQKKYKNTQNAFNSYLILIQNDLNNIKSSGGLTEYLINSRNRKKTYNTQFVRAKEAYTDFVKSAEKSLGDTQGLPGTLIDFGLSFIPNISIPANIAIGKVTKVISTIIEEKKFRSWEEIN